MSTTDPNEVSHQLLRSFVLLGPWLVVSRDVTKIGGGTVVESVSVIVSEDFTREFRDGVEVRTEISGS